MSKDMDNLSDSISLEFDMRKMKRVTEGGKKPFTNPLGEIPVVSISDCHGADLYAKEDDSIFVVRCAKCKQKCQGVEDPEAKE